MHDLTCPRGPAPRGCCRKLFAPAEDLFPFAVFSDRSKFSPNPRSIRWFAGLRRRNSSGGSLWGVPVYVERDLRNHGMRARLGGGLACVSVDRLSFCRARCCFWEPPRLEQAPSSI